MSNSPEIGSRIRTRAIMEKTGSTQRKVSVRISLLI